MRLCVGVRKVISRFLSPSSFFLTLLSFKRCMTPALGPLPGRGDDRLAELTAALPLARSGPELGQGVGLRPSLTQELAEHCGNISQECLSDDETVADSRSTPCNSSSVKSDLVQSPMANVMRRRHFEHGRACSIRSPDPLQCPLIPQVVARRERVRTDRATG